MAAPQQHDPIARLSSFEPESVVSSNLKHQRNLIYKPQFLHLAMVSVGSQIYPLVKKKTNVKVYGFLTLCPPDLSGVVGGETLNRCQVKLLLRL